MIKKTFSILVMALVIPSFTQGQEILSGEAFFKSFGIDPATTQVQSVELAPGMHAMRGVGGNIVASIGEQGTLIVDDQFEASVPRIREVIGNLGGESIDFVINTHWHFDHAGGNQPLAMGGSWIVAHESSREMLMHPQTINLVNVITTQEAYQGEALPVITFSDRMRFHFNGQTIDLLHFGPAHTSGDVAVLFRESGVVHMGDVYNGGYPFIDADNDGSFDGAIEFCEKVLAELGEQATIVPGHGQPTGKAAFEDYIAMLRTIRSRLSLLIEEGATLEKVLESGITAEWDEQRGNPTRLLDRAYHSMTR
ncbi:MAG: MBL fold metallo-hydrolase [Gammaproteobacteria bacterium]|nr:MBL fold metallo-hydrolase [Gammaproteobacteria bacterium]